MVCLECAIWELANLLYFEKFSFLCEMDESSSRFRFLKTFDKEKARVVNPIPKSTVYTNKWALLIFQESQVQRANKICTIEPGGVFKGEDIGLDVQELTQSTGYASSCRRLQITRRVDDIPLGHLTILSAA